MIKTAVEFLALSALKRGKVKVRGSEVHFRELSVAERGKMLEIAERNAAEAPAWLVVTCVTTPEGEPLFTDGQAAEIAKSAPEVVDAVAAAVMQLSGLAGQVDPKG